jgi:hypothetical protein
MEDELLSDPEMLALALAVPLVLLSWDAIAQRHIRHHELTDALDQIPPAHTSDPVAARRLACAAAQAVVDIQVAAAPTDLLCAIALQRLIEHVDGTRVATDLDEASFLARSAAAGGGGAAAEAVLAACGHDPVLAMHTSMHILQSLLGPRSCHSPAVDTVRRALSDLIESLS